MTHTTFIRELKRRFPEESRSWLLAALQNDALVWESLAGDYGGNIFEGQRVKPESINPAALALLVLDYPDSAEALQATPLLPIREDFISQVKDEQTPVMGLAGLKALQIRESRRIAGAWDKTKLHPPCLEPAVLACLYGMIPDPIDLLRSILNSRSNDIPQLERIELALHALLSNPSVPDDHITILEGLIEDLDRESQLAALRKLSAQRIDLASILSIPDSFFIRDRVHPDTIESAIKLVSQRSLEAEIYTLTGQLEQAVPAYSASMEAARWIQAHIAAELAELALEEQDITNALRAWDQAYELDPDCPSHLSGLTQALLAAGRSADAQALLATATTDPDTLLLTLTKTRLALLRGDRQGALEGASGIAKALDHSQDELNHLSKTQTATFVSTLIELQAPQAAKHIAQHAVSLHPNDPELLSWLVHAQCASLEPSEALSNAHLAVAFAPADIELQRQLADCSELVGDWSNALQERAAYLDQIEMPSTDDLRAQAYCSLQSDQAETAIQLCQEMLASAEADGETYTILGEAYIALEDLSTAHEHLTQAISLAPDCAGPWLALSRYHQKGGKPQRALETLQSGSHAAPELLELQLAIGESYLEQGALTQALASLREAAGLAASLTPKMNTVRDLHQGASLRYQIALRLGQTLSQLGHLEEANQVFCQAYEQTPTLPELAYAYAETLLQLGELRQALSPLQIVVESKPVAARPYLDYGRCLLALHQKGDLEVDLAFAIHLFEKTLQIEPAQLEATVLLAESLAALGETNQALDAYQMALESDLSEDPKWMTRISLGLGQAALELGQIEAAIAALKDASQSDPLNPQIQRSLSEAYATAGLKENAYQAARATLMLAPSSVFYLTWFTDQVLELLEQPGVPLPDAYTEVLHALERAAQLEPQRTDLLVKLAEINLQLGDKVSALDNYRRIADLTDPRSDTLTSDLYQTGERLLELGDPARAVICLEKALQTGDIDGSAKAPSLLQLLTSLAAAHYQSGGREAALEAIDQAILIAPDEPSLYLDKANLLFEANSGTAGSSQAGENITAALACLEIALNLDPHDPELHYRAAQIHRSLGNLPMALDHARQMILASDDAPVETAIARSLATDLAMAVLDKDQASNLSAFQQPLTAISPQLNKDQLIDLHCLRAELALEAGKERIGVDELLKVMELDPENPRALAIQSRLSLRRDDHQGARDHFETSLKALGDPQKAPPATLRSIAEAALETWQWATAIELWEQVVKRVPDEPRSYLCLARAYIWRAEIQRLCQATEAIHRAPGEEALSEDAHNKYEAAIAEVSRLIEGYRADQSDEDQEIFKETFICANKRLSRWQARGDAVFAPSQDHAQTLGEITQLSPEDVAAQVSCLREVGDLNAAGIAARTFSRSPVVLIQLALALVDEKPKQAFAAVHAAADLMSQDRSNDDHLAYGNIEIAPFIHYLLARLFRQEGKPSSQGNALDAILAALDLWSDEPRWHLIAAEILLSQSGLTDGGPGAAIPHLEQAIRIEPKYAPPYQILGSIHLQRGNLQTAIQILAKAAELVPEHTETWLNLAWACRLSGDLKQAAAHAERAMELAPDQVEPLLLRGEIDLETNNPRGAESRAQAALRVDPENPSAMLLLARALSGLNKPEEALALLEIALPLAPAQLPLELEKVRLLEQLYGEDQALIAIRELAELHPYEPSVLSRLALALDHAGQTPEAIRVAQRALRGMEVSETLGASEGANLHSLLGRLSRRGGQLDQALYHLSQAIQLAPEQVEPYLELAHTHQERREHTQAMQIYRQGIAAIPHDYRLYYEAGIALKECKDYLEAEKMLRKAAELAPQNPSVHRLLAAVVALNLVHNQREVKSRLQVNA